MVKGRGAAAPGVLEGSNGAPPAHDSTPTKGATGAMVSARRGRSAAANDSEPRRRSTRRKRKHVDRYQPEEWVQRAQKCRRRQHWHPATVVDERGCGSSQEYRVRWEGYSSSDDSWLPPTWITNAALVEYLVEPRSTKRAAVGGAGAATGRGRAPSNAAGKRKPQQRDASPESGVSSDAASVAVANDNRDKRQRERQARLLRQGGGGAVAGQQLAGGVRGGGGGANEDDSKRRKKMMATFLDHSAVRQYLRGLRLEHDQIVKLLVRICGHDDTVVKEDEPIEVTFERLVNMAWIKSRREGNGSAKDLSRVVQDVLAEVGGEGASA